MLTKTKMALAAALVLGTASGALASASGNDSGGFQVQTWQDIAKSRQDVQNQIHRAYHTQNPGNAYGYAPSDNPAPHAR
jgi:hypothetical protein